MDTGSSHTPVPRRSVFEDGFGKRHHAVGPGGEPLEVLEFAEHFTAVPSFEAALRDRVNALVGFQNTCFARVRSVQRLGQNGSRLVVVSDRVPGARLSTVLAVAKQQLLPLEVNAALCLIRQLVPAMAALHDKMPAVGHGAFAPERIIITPNARLVVVDHMLGAAVERLGYSHDRYWKELRLPLPTAAQPTFDFRADVMQIGMVALALILGRPLDSDDYPDQVAALAEGAWGLTATGGVEPLPPELRDVAVADAPARSAAFVRHGRRRMVGPRARPRNQRLRGVVWRAEIVHGRVRRTRGYRCSAARRCSFCACVGAGRASGNAGSAARCSRCGACSIGRRQRRVISVGSRIARAVCRGRCGADCSGTDAAACAAVCAASGEATRSSCAGASRGRADTSACQCSKITGCLVDTGQGSSACRPVAAPGFATASASSRGRDDRKAAGVRSRPFRR